MEYGQIWTRRQDGGGVEGSARIRFGVPQEFRASSARLILCGPFVGGAYVYIDPTPSKNETEMRTARSRRGMVRMRRIRMGGGLAWAGGLGMGAGASGDRGKALCQGRAGGQGRSKQQQRQRAYIRGYYIPPRDVVGSCSQVGLTSAYIGLQIGGVIPIRKVRPTFADVSLGLAYAGFGISLQGWEGDGQGRKFRFINTVSRYRCDSLPHDIPPFIAT